MYCDNIVNYIEVPPGCDTDIIAQMESLYKIELLSETREINLQNLLRLPKERPAERIHRILERIDWQVRICRHYECAGM